MIRRYLRQHLKLFIFSNLLTLSLSGLVLLKPWLLGELFEHLGAGLLPACRRDLLLLLAVFLAIALVTYGRTRLSDLLNQRLLARMRGDFFTHLLHLPCPFFEREASGQLLSCLQNDLAVVQSGLVGLPAKILRHGVVLFGGIYLLFTISPRLTTLLALLLPLLVILSRILGRRGYALAAALQENLGRGNAIAQEGLWQVTLLKAFGLEESYAARYQASCEEQVALSQKNSHINGLQAAIVPFMTAVALLGVVAYGILGGGGLTLGAAVKFTLYGFYLNGSLNGLAEAYASGRRALGAAGRLQKIQHMGEENYAGLPVPVFGEIRVENISFAYPARPDYQVLQNLSLVIPSGRLTVVAGPSGSGKSTLLKLLCGFYQPAAGQIMVDGQSLATISPRQWRRQLAVVSQDCQLLSATLRENILLGRPAEQLDEVVEIVGLEPLLRRLPRGLDTFIGEGGRQLSGGERQRVALARALLGRPALLLLDEPTAALDPVAEGEILELIKRIATRQTTLLICHHLPSWPAGEYQLYSLLPPSKLV